MTAGLVENAGAVSGVGFSARELAAIRNDFPILTREFADGVPLVYLDSAATSQRPQAVIDAEQDFLERSNAAVHRGAHALASEATVAFEQARESVASLVGADAGELVWTRNATEGLNLLAGVLSDPLTRQAAPHLALGPGDEVVVTEMEHHANLVPWQRACARSGATLRWIGVDDEGRLDLTDLDQVMGSRTKLLAFTHVSNVLGTVNPVRRLVEAARAVGALTVLDACQSVPHLPVDLRELGVDAAVFSAHKMLGPTGIGALVARSSLLEALPPFLTGGSMVERVTMETTTYREPPQRFEAGTQAVSQAVAWGVAAEYLAEIGLDRVAAHEHDISARILAGLADLPGVRVIGSAVAVAEAEHRIGAVSFAVDGVHPHDVGQVLDAAGVAVRVGHHCAQPIHRRFGVNASTRASGYLYTTPGEVDTFLDALSGVRAYFGAAS